VVDCKQLVEYRDRTLLNEWDAAAHRYTVTAEIRDGLRKARAELLADAQWQTSDWLGAVGVFASSMKLLTNLIGNALGVMPGTGLVIQTIKYEQITAQRTLQMLEEGRRINDIIEQGLLETAAKEFLGSIQPVGAALKLIWDLAQDTAGMREMGLRRAELKKEIEAQLAGLDAALGKLDRAVKESSHRIVAINEIKNGIDSALRKHCSSNPTGTYRGTISVDGNSGPIVLVLTSSDGVHAGTILIALLDGGPDDSGQAPTSWPIQQVQIRGQDLTFRLTLPDTPPLDFSARFSVDYREITNLRDSAGEFPAGIVLRKDGP
jgi:hypothetical protein